MKVEFRACFAVRPLFLDYGRPMDFENAQQYWALLAAAAIAAGVLIFVGFRLLQNSSRGRLAAEVGTLRKKEKAARKASRAATRARSKLDKLGGRSESVKPRIVEEARGRLADAEALLKIADDQVLVTRNRVRTIILEEYPPKRHEVMRRRLLPDAAAEN